MCKGKALESTLIKHKEIVKTKDFFLIGLAAAILMTFPASLGYAESNDANFAYISRGFYRILTAAFQIPQYMLNKTLSEPLGVGTVNGALTGAYYSVVELLGGTLDVGRGAAPYAKYLIFFA